MSHYSLAVFTKEGQSAEELVELYTGDFGNLSQFVGKTITEIAEDTRDDLECDYERYYAEWKANPKDFASKHPSCLNNDYMKQLPERLKWTDEQLYRYAIKGYENQLILEDEWVEVNSPYTSKWDWYVIGGRFEDRLIQKGTHDSCDEAYVADLDFEAMKKHDKADFTTYAVITPDKKWHECEQMDLFGTLGTDDLVQEWDTTYHKRFIKPALKENWYLTIVDCHV